MRVCSIKCDYIVSVLVSQRVGTIKGRKPDYKSEHVPPPGDPLLSSNTETDALYVFWTQDVILA